MVSTEEIVGRVRQQQIQPDWRVHYSSRVTYTFRTIAYLIFAILFVGVAFYLLVSGNVYVPRFLPDSMVNPDLWFVIDLLIVLIAIIAMFVYAVKSLIKVINPTEHFVVITPEGVLVYEGKKSERLVFAELSQLQVTRPNLVARVLNGVQRSGGVVTLQFDNRFGSAKTITNEAMQAYQQSSQQYQNAPR